MEGVQMSNSAEQLDKGPLRQLITPGQKKAAKKQHKKRLRSQAKDPDKEPQSNRYTGGWAV